MRMISRTRSPLYVAAAMDEAPSRRTGRKTTSKMSFCSSSENGSVSVIFLPLNGASLLILFQIIGFRRDLHHWTLQSDSNPALAHCIFQEVVLNGLVLN